eukprot:gene13672-biopygen9581
MPARPSAHSVFRLLSERSGRGVNARGQVLFATRAECSLQGRVSPTGTGFFHRGGNVPPRYWDRPFGYEEVSNSYTIHR